MDAIQTKRSVELAKNLKPDITRIDELRKLITESEKELQYLKLKVKSESDELIGLMVANGMTYTFNDIEIAKHFKSRYLRIKKDDIFI